jgi:nucleoside-diphosphate-sugar epimerase
VEYLIRKKIDVLALGRKNFDQISSIRQKKLLDAKYISLNMNEISYLDRAIAEIGWDVGEDCVFINLAWGGELGLSDLNVAFQMRNVENAVTALEVAKKIGCSRFIQIGTMEEVFTNKYLELDHHKDNQYNRHVIYSLAKISAKNALIYKSIQLEMDFIYVLHSHVMGPDDDKNSFLQVTLQKLIKGDELIFSSGEQLFDVISLQDCCLGYFLICQKGLPSSQYWVGSGYPRRLREYVERMYFLFPSDKEMQFGKMPYNDIVLGKDVFSITNLSKDTDYLPTMTFDDCVKQLHRYLIAIS